ncbi:hypothetical protein I317_04693 [Kwoniella heveanensis CBS 569]|nr:hypothetical protein I317_04693 [Kwoniella heveanensis CBS 569]
MPTRVALASSPEAGPSRKARPARGSPEVEGGLEEEEGWTIETFENQPVTKSTTNIAVPSAVIAQLKQVKSRIEEGVEQLKEAAYAIEDAKQDDPSIQEVEAALFRAYDQQYMIELKIEVLKRIVERLQADEELTNIENDYEKEVQVREKEYIKKSPWAKYKDVEDYQNFRSGLWEINHANSACPPVSTFLEKGENDESDDEEIDFGGATQNYRCPLTLRLFEDAVTSTKCGHNFSRAAIISTIENNKKNRRPSKCPVSGCSKMLEKTDLKPNPGLQKRADEFQRRQLLRAEENEDGNETLMIGDEEEDED